MKNNPYVRGFSIHDNLIENSGSYGITYKGVNGPNNSIYNNTIRITGLVRKDLSDDFWQGIGVQYHTGSNYTKIYNNTIEKTKGPGIKIGSKAIVHDNLILGCGTGNSADWGHGIVTFTNSNNSKIYDNVILQAKRYGIYGKLGTGNYMEKNSIGDCGAGEWGGKGLIEGIGSNANIYKYNVADFNFSKWSNDFNYSNDIFKLSDSSFPSAPQKLHVVTP